MVSAWASAGAQTALTTAAEGRNAPGGTAVMSVRPGTKVAVVSTREANVLVTIGGWVDGSRLTGKLDTFPASVDAKAPLRVRASASGSSTILAELHARTGVHTIGKSGTWTRIKRSAWIPASALPKAVASVASAKPPAAPAVSPASPVPAGAMSVSKPTKLLAAPAGSAVAELAAGTVVQTLAHDHGFAKGRIEGWVPERELSPAGRPRPPGGPGGDAGGAGRKAGGGERGAPRAGGGAAAGGGGGGGGAISA